MRSNSAEPVICLANGTAAHPGADPPARPFVTPADLRIACNGGGTSLRAAQHASNLPGRRTSCTSPSDGDPPGRLPLQISYCAAHDGGYYTNRRPSNAASTQDASEDCRAAYQVRQNPA